MTSAKLTKLEGASGWLLPVLVGAVAWYALIRMLWTDWAIDPQYSYGFLVPLLVIGLLLKRWEDHPKPTITDHLTHWVALLLLTASTLLIMVMIPMAEANPDWRPLGGVTSLAVVTLTLSLVALRGGMSWVRHFSFPICFFLIAVPWPRNFEQEVMSPLMAWNTTSTLEILHWMGIEAVGQGNLIVLDAGVLGIEESCSGIRSLQSGLMVALFFGEFFRLSKMRRLILLLVALLAALIGNICRNALLALIAAYKGLEAVPKWHDMAGLLVLFITFGAILGCAWYWKNRTAVSSLVNHPVLHAAIGVVPRVASISALVLLLGSMAGTELWFGAHERRGVAPWSWSLHPRPGDTGVFTVPVSSTTLRMLFYPKGFSEKWIASKGAQGQVFYFQWPPGRMAAHAVLMHNPEVCLSNIGMILTSRLEPIIFKIGDVQIPFNAWLFNDHGRPVYVFHTLMEQGAYSSDTQLLNDSPIGRLHAVLAGHRNHGQRMVEVAFWNLANEQEARLDLVRYLQESVALKGTAGDSNSFKP